MTQYRKTFAGADSNDLARYEELAAWAAGHGFDGMGMGMLAEHTLDQEKADMDDSWLRFSAGCLSLTKIVETTLVHDVLSKEHIEKNARLAGEKSRILARHGLKGTTWILEPMWLPESFYAKHPEMRGARCDNPCLALNDYYAPCLDNDEVLAHYREAVAGLLRLAPEFEVLVVGTNDSGAGICWTSGLYPGANGPEHCKEVAMGTRMRRWFEAMLAGAADAGRRLEIVFNPVHFSRFETRDTIEKLPEHATVSPGGNYPGAVEHLRRRGRLVAGGASPTLVPWCLSPVVETPFPYFNLEALWNVARQDADIVTVGGFAPPVAGKDTVATMAILSGFKNPPASTQDIEQRVGKIAEEHAGPRLAPALVSAWREVDYALRLWNEAIRAGDTNHQLHPQYSVIGSRWMIRPIVPDPSLIPDEDKAYYNRHRHQSRNREKADNFFMVESTMNYEIDEMKWPVAIYDSIITHMDRAKALLDEAAAMAEKEDEEVRRRLRIQYGRVMALRAVWRTQRNVMRGQSIIEFFTGEKQDKYWHVIRKDESFHEPATYRRFFLEMMDDEIENCREMLSLMRDYDVEMFTTGDVETTFVLPRDLPELVEKKIALMEAHKKDIDVLFPNCPAETYADPTYEWADRRFRGKRK